MCLSAFGFFVHCRMRKARCMHCTFRARFCMLIFVFTVTNCTPNNDSYAFAFFANEFLWKRKHNSTCETKRAITCICFKIRHRVQRIVNRVVRIATASSCRATPENRITNARDHKAVYDDGITTRKYRCTRPPVIVRRSVRDKLFIQCPRSPCQVIVLCYHRTLSS